MSKPLITRIATFSLLILIFACQSRSGDLPTVGINPNNANKVTLEEAFPEYRLVNISLPDSAYFGNIEQIKTNDKYLFLLDPFQSKTVTILDKNGDFVNQLNRVGQGPGEYASPYAFAVDRYTDQLLVYDREKFEILAYTIPNLEYVRSYRMNAYLMNFEVISESEVLMVRDDNKDSGILNGLELWSREFQPMERNLSDTRSAVIELSYASSIGRHGSEYLYMHPFTGIVSGVRRKELVPYFKADFGKKEIPEELYEIEDAVRFENALENKKYALWGRYPIFRDNLYMFWYMYGDIGTNHLISLDLDNKTYRIYSEISFEQITEKLPVPVGIDSDKYISLIPNEILDDDYSAESPVGEVIRKGIASDLPILVFY